MNLRILCFSFLLSVCICGCKTAGDVSIVDESFVKVKIHVTFTQPPCGGAPGNTGLEKAPLKDANFYIRRGLENDTTADIVADVVTDSSGNIYRKLHPGNYVIIWPEQMYPKDTTGIQDNDFTHYDKKCMAGWWKKHLLQIKVKPGKDNVFQLDLKRACYVSSWCPCEKYIGPPPPVRNH